MRHVALETHRRPVTALPAGSRSVIVRVAGPTDGRRGVSVHATSTAAVSRARPQHSRSTVRPRASATARAAAGHVARPALTPCSAHEHCGHAASPRRREQVVVHRDHHRDEDDGVVEEVQLDARHPQLHDARRHRAAEEVVADDRLHLQQAVLDVVEELDPERDRPPEWSTLPVNPLRSSHRPISITTA